MTPQQAFLSEHLVTQREKAIACLVTLVLEGAKKGPWDTAETIEKATWALNTVGVTDEEQMRVVELVKTMHAMGDQP